MSHVYINSHTTGYNFIKICLITLYLNEKNLNFKLFINLVL